MQISKLGFGSDCVYLAHVSATVLFLHVVYVQKPCFMFVVLVMGDADAWISGDYVIVHRQNGRLFKMNPGDLHINCIEDFSFSIRKLNN